MGKGRRLKVLRAEQEVTQLQMARAAGMNATRYWQIENGEGPDPTLDEQKAVAAALDVKVGEIDWPAVGAARAS